MRSARPSRCRLGGAIEGQAGYSCDVFGNDCHLLVVTGNEIFEVYRANVTAQGVQSQCLARWRMDALYPATGRGEHCTSADAAGFPIAPLLFNADEVAAAAAQPDGDLGHAIRFILPNARHGQRCHPGRRFRPAVRAPGTHAGAPSGPAASVPYGARLRLRSDFPMAGYNARRTGDPAHHAALRHRAGRPLHPEHLGQPSARSTRHPARRRSSSATATPHCRTYNWAEPGRCSQTASRAIDQFDQKTGHRGPSAIESHGELQGRCRDHRCRRRRPARGDRGGRGRSHR
jgi:hypothetical protein